MDLRIQRSKEYLWRSFYQLMTEEPAIFSNITINQICQTALVHRSTFYKHFPDKYALLEFGLDKLFSQYLAITSEKRTLSPFYWANAFFENSAAQRLLEKQKRDADFSAILHSYSVKMMTDSAADYLTTLPKSSLPEDLMIAFLVETVFTLSQWQSKQKAPISAQEMDAYYQQLINQRLFLTSDSNNFDIDD